MHKGFEETGGLTLPVRHMLHGGILHHSCRTSTRHHVGSTGKASLGSHGELLGIVHHLRLAW